MIFITNLAGIEDWNVQVHFTTHPCCVDPFRFAKWDRTASILESHWWLIAENLGLATWPEENAHERCCIVLQATWNGRSLVRGNFLETPRDLRCKEIEMKQAYRLVDLPPCILPGLQQLVDLTLPPTPTKLPPPSYIGSYLRSLWLRSNIFGLQVSAKKDPRQRTAMEQDGLTNPPFIGKQMERLPRCALDTRWKCTLKRTRRSTPKR